MRYASLGSGSRGNATLVEGGGTRVLVDCGFGAGEAERRLAALGVVPRELAAILVTHEHTDHVRGVAPLSRRHGIPVWATPGSWRRNVGWDPERLHPIGVHEKGFRIGDLYVIPVAVPHDAREPCQFVLECGGRRLGMLTDTGSVTPHIRDLMCECDALMLECNHDPDILRRGPYPPRVRERVAGPFGHLSNLQAARLLDALPHERLTGLLVAHVSETNNRPDLARRALLAVSAALDARLTLAGQDRPTPWLSV